jgi:cytoskeletal protein RodZ
LGDNSFWLLIGEKNMKNIKEFFKDRKHVIVTACVAVAVCIVIALVLGAGCVGCAVKPAVSEPEPTSSATASAKPTASASAKPSASATAEPTASATPTAETTQDNSTADNTTETVSNDDSGSYDSGAVADNNSVSNSQTDDSSDSQPVAPAPQETVQPATPAPATPAPCTPTETKKWVVDTPAKAAYDEQIADHDVTICNKCGKQFTGPTQLDDCIWHCIAEEASYHTETVYKIVHHDAVAEVGHWETTASGC